MASSIIKNNSAPRPTTNGWQVGFRVRGLGFIVLIPCDTRRYNLSIGSGSQVYLPDEGGWVAMNTAWDAAIPYGTYYMVNNKGTEMANTAHDTLLVNLPAITVTLK